MSSALILVAASALGIGAASFASETGFGDGDGIYLGTSLGSETGMKRAKI